MLKMRIFTKRRWRALRFPNNHQFSKENLPCKTALNSRSFKTRRNWYCWRLNKYDLGWIYTDKKSWKEKRWWSFVETGAAWLFFEVFWRIVLSSNCGKEFVELFNFTYDAIPISLAIDKSGVYIGIGNRQIPFEKNGMVLWVEYS